jgi:folate-binding protein YgfZ
MTRMTQLSSNPLRDLHGATEAEFQNWGEIEIVQTFGEPQAEYAAIHKSCGMIDLPQRGILELTGKDRLPFLNNLLTNQTWDKSKKVGLEHGHGVYAFLLNLRGRIVADMNVLELGDRTLLEIDARLATPLQTVLEKYLFGEQVKIENRIGELHEIALHGPAAAQIAGVTIENQLGSIQTRIFDADAIVWRDDVIGAAGYHLIIPTASAAHVWKNIIEQFATSNELGKRLLRPIGWAAFNAARVEAGRSLFAIDFDGAPIASASPGKKDDAANTGTLPAETGQLDRAVSFTKGCYLGQEIVARMHARNQVARQIAGIRMEDDALPIAGAEVFDEQSVQVGVVTSSTISPLLSNAAICLAMLKRLNFEVGTKLRIPAEGAIRPGTVVELPFLKN